MGGGWGLQSGSQIKGLGETCHGVSIAYGWEGTVQAPAHTGGQQARPAPAEGPSCHTRVRLPLEADCGETGPHSGSQEQKAETAHHTSEPIAAEFYPLRCLDEGEPEPTRRVAKDSWSLRRWLLGQTGNCTDLIFAIYYHVTQKYIRPTAF